MSDARKIAVLVRDRQGEALRMAVGLTLENDEVSVFNIGDPIESNDSNNLNVETLGEFDCGRYSVNGGDNGFEQMNIEDIAQKILECDHIVPY